MSNSAGPASPWLKGVSLLALFGAAGGARDLFTELRSAGLQRVIVTGADPSPLNAVVCSKPRQPAVRTYLDPGLWWDRYPEKSAGAYAGLEQAHACGMKPQFSGEGLPREAFLRQSKDFAAAWIPMDRAVCEATGEGDRIACPEGQAVPDREGHAFVSAMEHEAGFDWLDRANGAGRATALVVPGSHWDGAPYAVGDSTARQEWTVGLGDVLCWATPYMVGRLAAEVRDVFRPDLRHAVTDSIAFGALGLALHQIGESVRVSYGFEHASYPKPDRETFFAVMHEKGYRVLLDGDRTIVVPRKMMPVLQRWEAAHPDTAHIVPLGQPTETQSR